MGGSVGCRFCQTNMISASCYVHSADSARLMQLLNWNEMACNLIRPGELLWQARRRECMMDAQSRRARRHGRQGVQIIDTGICVFRSVIHRPGSFCFVFLFLFLFCSSFLFLSSATIFSFCIFPQPVFAAYVFLFCFLKQSYLWHPLNFCLFLFKAVLFMISTEFLV